MSELDFEALALTFLLLFSSQRVKMPAAPKGVTCMEFFSGASQESFK